jgi:hypothetical protein
VTWYFQNKAFPVWPSSDVSNTAISDMLLPVEQRGEQLILINAGWAPNIYLRYAEFNNKSFRSFFPALVQKERSAG